MTMIVQIKRLHLISYSLEIYISNIRKKMNESTCKQYSNIRDLTITFALSLLHLLHFTWKLLYVFSVFSRVFFDQSIYQKSFLNQQ